MLRKILIAYSLFLNTLHLDAINYLPWFGGIYDVQSKTTTSFNLYNTLASDKCPQHRPTCNYFVDVGLEGIYSEDIALEVNVIAANGKSRHLNLDCIDITGRYLLMNDILDDPVSLTAGLTVTQVFKQAGLLNFSAFHHGGIECEFHGAVGREISCSQFWVSRLCGVFGLGIADMGSPWIRGNIIWELNHWNAHRFEFFIRTLWGLGGNALNVRDFQGYGPIAHQLIDGGASYSYGFDYGVFLTCEYAYRMYARNCPKNVNILTFSLTYPFSL